MKITPIYILLLIFFLNFNLVSGMEVADTSLNPLSYCPINYAQYCGIDYSLNSSRNSYQHSLNVTFVLDNKAYCISNVLHRLRANIGLSNSLFEIDYEFGHSFGIFKYLYLLPYINLGTNYYSIAYGGGLEFQYVFKSFYFTSNIYNRNTDKLFGHTDAQQWYQSGFGAKIGLTFAIK